MKVLIVDDEPLARRGLRREVEELPGLTVAGECGSRDEAVEMIVARRPDVVLLDIQLGRSTAFDVIEQVGVDAMPLVVFVTAYDRHAVRAFEVNAVDYVLKPVDPSRLREALDRAARLMEPKAAALHADRLDALLYAGDGRGGSGGPGGRVAEPLDRLVVRDGEKLVFVDVARIDWIEAVGNQMCLHVARRTHTVRSTMTRLHRKLGEGRFIRIRRSTLVNTKAISAVEHYGKGTYVLTLRTGEELVSSRYQAAAMRAMLRPLA